MSLRLAAGACVEGSTFQAGLFSCTGAEMVDMVACCRFRSFCDFLKWAGPEGTEPPGVSGVVGVATEGLLADACDMISFKSNFGVDVDMTGVAQGTPPVFGEGVLKGPGECKGSGVYSGLPLTGALPLSAGVT